MSQSTSPAPTIDRIAYTPTAAALATGRSRSRLYKAIARRELVARKDGRATIIEADELRRWIKSLPAKDPQAATA